MDSSKSPEPAIAYIALPRSVDRLSITKFLLIGTTVFAAMLIWALADPAMRQMMLLIFIIWAIAIPIGILFSNGFGSERAAHVDTALTNQLSEGIIRLDCRLRNIYWGREWWTWDDFVAICEEARLDPPRTIVDMRVRARLERLDLTPELLEPEPILSSGKFGRRTTVFMIVLYCLFTLLQLSAGLYVYAALFGAFGVVLAASYPPLRDLFRTFRVDEGNLIAGMGSLSHKGDKRWTTNDAVMLVQTTSGKPPYYVSFVGEAGYKLITFTDEDDPDFVKLWQRWNHPKPRPELVVE